MVGEGATVTRIAAVPVLVTTSGEVNPAWNATVAAVGAGETVTVTPLAVDDGRYEELPD